MLVLFKRVKTKELGKKKTNDVACEVDFRVCKGWVNVDACFSNSMGENDIKVWGKV